MEKTGEKQNILINCFVSDEQCRIYTFEGDDYANNKLTLLLCPRWPDTVYVTTPFGYNVEDAVREVIFMNPHLSLEPVQMEYMPNQDIRMKRTTRALKIFPRQLKVDHTGRLVG